MLNITVTLTYRELSTALQHLGPLPPAPKLRAALTRALRVSDLYDGAAYRILQHPYEYLPDTVTMARTWQDARASGFDDPYEYLEYLDHCGGLEPPIAPEEETA